jgi:ferritin-like metal-binding protein YciE
MKVRSLRDRYAEQLRSLYDAEQQLIKALPRMAKAASSEELRSALEDHLAKTRDHAQRIEDIFQRMGRKPGGRKCGAMESLVNEGSVAMEKSVGGAAKDAAVTAAARRVEQYEIAGYGCVLAHATVLGDDSAAASLAQTLKEEEDADKVLSGIAKRPHLEASREQIDSEGRKVKNRSMSLA